MAFRPWGTPILGNRGHISPIFLSEELEISGKSLFSPAGAGNGGMGGKGKVIASLRSFSGAHTDRAETIIDFSDMTFSTLFLLSLKCLYLRKRILLFHLWSFCFCFVNCACGYDYKHWAILASQLAEKKYLWFQIWDIFTLDLNTIQFWVSGVGAHRRASPELLLNSTMVFEGHWRLKNYRAGGGVMF